MQIRKTIRGIRVWRRSKPCTCHRQLSPSHLNCSAEPHFSFSGETSVWKHVWLLGFFNPDGGLPLSGSSVSVRPPLRIFDQLETFLLGMFLHSMVGAHKFCPIHYISGLLSVIPGFGYKSGSDLILGVGALHRSRLLNLPASRLPPNP